MKIQNVLLFMIVCGSMFSQDSTRYITNLEYEIKGKHITFSRNATTINGNQRITDNPLNHFAIYGGAVAKLSLKNKYMIDLGIFMEQRSYSGGNNVLDHIVMIPKITFRHIDTFNIFQIPLKVQAIGGDLWDEDFNDILRIYNLDFQGSIGSIGYKNIWYSEYSVADLSHNVGLALTELKKRELSYRTVQSLVGFSWTINTLLDTPLNADNDSHTDYNLGLFSRFDWNENSSFKAQVERRKNSRIGAGYAAGGQFQFSTKNQKLKFRYQYYQDNYNAEYYSIDEIDYTTSWHNFTGTQVYPLKNFYRPINQWAFFTSRYSSNIHNIELKYTLMQPIYKQVYIMGTADINLFHGSFFNEWLIYPAYECGFGINFDDFYSFECSLTNKHMNLDRPYQGHSLSRLPYPSIHVKMNN